MIKTKKINYYDGLELKEATFNRKQFPTHFHDFYSIGIINTGIEKLTIKDKSYIALPKTVVILNENELHSNSFYNNENWTYQTVNLNADAIKFIAKANNIESTNSLIFQNIIEDEFLFNSIANFHNNPQQNTKEQINNISNYLLNNFLQKTEKEKFHYYHWGNIINETIYFFNTHFDSKINIETLATTHSKTPFQFIRAFKAHTGLTPIAYLTLIRLNKSKQLLTNGNPLVNTAYECGFFDQSHFTNCFKKYFGISPKQFCNNYSVLLTE
ncbi:MAG: helix-turn-helix transcriptional regulator [Bacteroidetes bacterium]|nr:helix-turn-helix transcriptional regulator [Bacteroidota bacterium]